MQRSAFSRYYVAYTVRARALEAVSQARPQLHHLLDGCPLAQSTPCLSFHFCTMGIIIPPTLQGIFSGYLMHGKCSISIHDIVMRTHPGFLGQ